MIEVQSLIEFKASCASGFTESGIEAHVIPRRADFDILPDDLADSMAEVRVLCDSLEDVDVLSSS
jgi:hypothetical protein